MIDSGSRGRRPPAWRAASSDGEPGVRRRRASKLFIPVLSRPWPVAPGGGRRPLITPTILATAS